MKAIVRFKDTAAIAHYLIVIILQLLFIMPHKMGLTFPSVAETLISCGTVCNYVIMQTIYKEFLSLNSPEMWLSLSFSRN